MKTSKAILRLQERLLTRRAELHKTLNDQQEMMTAVGAPVSDYVNAAIDAEQQEISSQLVAVERRELQRIEEALERLRDGLFGVCEHCDGKIPLARIQALPYATMCIKCQRELEESRSGWTDVEAPEKIIDLGLGDNNMLLDHNHFEVF